MNGNIFVPSLSRSTVFWTTAGGAVMLLSFFLTLEILDRLEPSPEPISVAEASYGLNCNDSSSNPRTRSNAKAGNVTGIVAGECNGYAQCAYKIDVSKLGDPAPAC